MAGAQTGSATGRGAGPALFDPPGSRLFERAHVRAAEAVIEHDGVGRALALARPVPVIRSFLNPLRGCGQPPTYLLSRWNAPGGTRWGPGLCLPGHCNGSTSFTGRNLEVVALPVVAVSVLPTALQLVHGWYGPR